jgi:hypothetical protein
MSKTVNVPADWKPPAERKERKPQWAFDVGPSNTDDGVGSGCRLVGVDENGQKLYAPPPVWR